MSQLNELSRVKARIKALTEKTVSNGCTEAEAMSAAEMVGRLLERYALTMDEIEIRAEQCVQLKIPLGGQRRRPIDGCVPAIARFCECKVWLNRTEFGPCYVFFGFEPDTAIAPSPVSWRDSAPANIACRGRRCAWPRPVFSTAWRSGWPSGWRPCTGSATSRLPRSARRVPR
jgi:hypothetical protein